MLHIQVATALKNHPLYAEFVQVKNRLLAEGNKCWIAGGAVRDFILKKEPIDFDLVTDATTEKILELFPDAVPVGVQFGVVKIPLADGLFFDLATFRRESDYTDGRRPSFIDFATPEEDAFRRDFTMNALFWDDQEQQVIDFTSGAQDIKNKVIRCVGDPLVRFQEDHLRILRLLRFSLQLQFTIESDTLAAALQLVGKIKNTSGERIWSEIQKMMPHIDWPLILKNTLAVRIFELIFPVKIASLSPMQKISEFNQIQFFYFLLGTASFSKELTHCLKKEMHLSKNDFKIFETVQFCCLHQLSTAEWVYESERNPLVLDVLKFLSQIQKLPDLSFAEIEQKFHSKPNILVDGHDLKGVVPDHQIGSILKKIRLRQLAQPDLDKKRLLENLL